MVFILLTSLKTPFVIFHSAFQVDQREKSHDYLSLRLLDCHYGLRSATAM